MLQFNDLLNPLARTRPYNHTGYDYKHGWLSLRFETTRPRFEALKVPEIDSTQKKRFDFFTKFYFEVDFEKK